MGHINWIRACWQCDGCGKDFIVEVDTAFAPSQRWSTTDIAEDAVRGGQLVPAKGRAVVPNSSSVQHGMILCGDCTSIADEIGPGDHRPTKAEILRALGAPENA